MTYLESNSSIEKILKRYNQMVSTTDVKWCINMAVHSSEQQLEWLDEEEREAVSLDEQLLFWMPYRRIEGWLMLLGYLMECLTGKVHQET